MGLAVTAVLILSDTKLSWQAGRVYDPVVAIRNVNVVPMDTERIEIDQTVILRGATIERVGSARQTVVPRGATVIERHGSAGRPTLDEALCTATITPVPFSDDVGTYVGPD
jgi:hypothetical protein